ncbi:MAG: DNA mismatch repair endonuclease MutL [Proteobacteria bacterium]|nr:DNA mismatch repair endonuclease MutL [Pseudomonadota bacterium]
MKIKILAENISNKIAAGEIVERPASVVKELVENALDAKGTRILVEIEKGGKSLIRVSDDGMGMVKDDALLSIERYATSKIETDEDLFSINTFGFRGEALPSIASVSRFSLVTKENKAQTGIEIKIEGGKVFSVTDKGAPEGTMVSVKDLFFNTPARRKFLKSIDTEMGHIADVISTMALANSNVQFKLIHNGRTVYNLLSSPDSTVRTEEILGKDTKSNLYSLGFSKENISISGWTSSPVVKRHTTRGIYIYVNGRFVRDKIVQHALLEGYTSRLIKGEFPVAVISIALPYNEVDVNVHPAKHEVRFSEPNKIHETVRAAVKETLDLLDPYKKSVEDFIQKGQHYKSIGVSETPVVYQPGVKDIPAQNETVSNLGAKNVDPYIESGKQKQVSHIQENLWEKKLFKDLIVLGQLHGTYIICEAVEGIFLIDQHAAHERILYEQIKAKADSFGYSIQILLVPEVIEFGYRETGIFEKLLPDFQRAGFEVEPFGGNAFAVKSVPAFIADKDIKAIIIETVEKLIETGFIPGLERASDELLKLIACHGAIRANQKLSGKEMTTLLSQLDDCKMPSHCPHGRPTWVKFSIKELDKFFKRAV